MSFVSPVSPDDQAALKSNEPISTKSLKRDVAHTIPSS